MFLGDDTGAGWGLMEKIRQWVPKAVPVSLYFNMFRIVVNVVSDSDDDIVWLWIHVIYDYTLGLYWNDEQKTPLRFNVSKSRQV